MNDNELLKKALEEGIIDVATIRCVIEMNERNKYLEQHKYEIYLGKDNKWRTYLPGKPRKLIKRKTRDELEYAIIDFYRGADTRPTFEELFEDWIEAKVRYGEISNATIDRYRLDFNRYIKNSPINEQPLYLVTEYELMDMIKTTIHEKDLTAKAFSGMRTVISGVFKHAKSRGETTISISQFFKDLEIGKKAFKRVPTRDDEQVFTDEEFRRIEEYIVNSKLSYVNLAILFAFYTGLRSGEISGLKKSDVHGDYVYISRTEIHYKGNNGKEVYEIREEPKTINAYRRVYLPPEALKIIHVMNDCIPNEDALFINDEGNVLHSYVCTKKLYRICDAVGIKRRSLHKCRKTYATKLINGNVDKKIVMKTLGHSDIRTTESYYYFDNATSEQSKVQILSAISY